MEVTRVRFPQMEHMGDITKLNGAELPPVDIIAGGSPCQDLSVAGDRAGLAGARSGLFMEQIRVIKEMREADRKRGRTAQSVRPRFMAWENVPGAFSSGEQKGEDFRKVLEETLRICDSAVAVPRPPSGTWKSAGCVLGEGYSLAWRVLDAQYWGVPQRRARIFLVADFSGTSAPQILFEQDSLPGYSEACQRAWQGFATGTGSSSEAAGGEKVGCLTPWDTQQQRIFDSCGVAPTLAGADGGGGRNPGGLLYMGAYAANQRDEVRDLHDIAGALGAQPGMKQQTFVAAFKAGNGKKASGVAYTINLSPTLIAQSSNLIPSILCLNDQGGKRIDCSEDVTATLRAQMSGHPPLVYENHGIAARYTGPHEVAPTMSARYGTGGNNVPLVKQNPEVFCIVGNTIDRQPQNGGNGTGVQTDISYTLTATDRHAVYSRQRTDVFREDEVASTQSARQHKDATDLVYQETVGALTSSDKCGPNNQYVSQDKLIVEGPKLIRRLIPLECERLQGFPDGWTDIPGASDSARYKALGNSVAIPCVAFVLRGIALVLRAERKDNERNL